MAGNPKLSESIQLLQQINGYLSESSNKLEGLVSSFSFVEDACKVEKNSTLITKEKVESAQELTSKRAVPFLYRQVEQIEDVIEFATKAQLEEIRDFKVQKEEYENTILRNQEALKTLEEIRNYKLRAERQQNDMLELKSSISNIERQLNSLKRQIHIKTKNKGTKRLSTRIESQNNVVINEYKQNLQNIRDSKDELLNKIKKRDPRAEIINETNNSLDYLRKHFSKIENWKLEDEESLNKGIELIDSIELMTKEIADERNSQTIASKHRFLGRLFKLYYPDSGPALYSIIEVLSQSVAEQISYNRLESELSSLYSPNQISTALLKLESIGIINVLVESFGGSENRYISLNI